MTEEKQLKEKQLNTCQYFLESLQKGKKTKIFFLKKKGQTYIYPVRRAK